MDRFKRNERIAALVQVLCNNPNRVYSLSYFAELFGAAKSTISEDIMIVKNTFEQLGLGIIETMPGAAGGVRYRVKTSKEENRGVLSRLAEILSDPGRIITGGFLYMTDVIYDPQMAHSAGKILASCFDRNKIQYVITVETKGIPIALMTAEAMGIPLIIARRGNNVTEGSTVNINYLSGSTGRIQTMSLSKRAMEKGASVLIVDDFMKAGGTARGMIDLMKEFEAKVEGIGVLITTTKPLQKLVDNYVPLMYLDEVDETNRIIRITPNHQLMD
jgi:purine operon repressor